VIIIDKKIYGIFSDKMVFYPNETEIATLVGKLHLNSLLRVRQTSVNISDKHKNLIHREPMRTSCVDLTLPIDKMYHKLDKQTARYLVRKAEKMMDRIDIKMNEDIAYKDFLKLHNTFVVKKGHARPLSDKEFEKYMPMSDVYVIYYDSRPMCGHVDMPDQSSGRIRALYSASTRLNSPEDSAIVGPLNTYLHWHEFKRYHELGYRSYDFGGFSTGGPLATFKKHFGGIPVEEYGYVFTGGLTAPVMRVSYRTMLWLNGKRIQFTVSMQRRKKVESLPIES
jgi:hypothetical protein